MEIPASGFWLPAFRNGIQNCIFGTGSQWPGASSLIKIVGKTSPPQLHIHPWRIQQIKNYRIGLVILINDLAFVLDERCR